MSSEIELDFYIPVKDGEAFIGECIEGVLSQSLRPKRVFVYVNMTSTDRTYEIVKSYPVILKETHVPLSDTRNIAINELETDWIGCCDADVILDKHWVEKLWSRRDSGACMITGNTQERIKTSGDRLRSIMSPHNWGEVDIDNPYMVVPDIIADRKKLVDVGGYLVGLVNYEDADICRRLREKGERFFYAADAMAQHYRSDNTRSVLDLRWKYSIERQKSLFASIEGMLKKTRNNFALASMNFCKSLELADREVSEAAALIPLHHLAYDLERFEAKKTSSNTIRSQFASDLESIQLDDWKAYLDIIDKFEENEVTQEFGRLFETYLKRVISLLKQQEVEQNDNPSAISEQDWSQLESRLRSSASKLSEKDFKNCKMLDAANESELAEIDSLEYGVLGFRQPLFPEKKKFWRCLDLSSLLASKSKRLVWTETFQGSSVIAFVNSASL